MLKVGQPGDPVAEPTSFGWVLMSPEKETEVNELMCAMTSIDNYENLCRLDALECDRYCTRWYCCKVRFQRSTQEKQGWLVRNKIDAEKQFYCTAKQQIG